MTLIKKYGNRRLYDTDASRYVTLEELAGQIRRGADVRVVDAKTGADLTQATLAQIILESRRAAELLPVPLLKHLIRMGDDALAEFFGQYLSWALGAYVQAKQGLQSALPFGGLGGFGGLPLPGAELLGRVFGGARPFGAGTEGGREPPDAPQDAREEVAALRRELEELKRSVGTRRRRG